MAHAAAAACGAVCCAPCVYCNGRCVPLPTREPFALFAAGVQHALLGAGCAHGCVRKRLVLVVLVYTRLDNTAGSPTHDYTQANTFDIPVYTYRGQLSTESLKAAVPNQQQTRGSEPDWPQQSPRCKRMYSSP
jgi:hypothetical protein